MTEVRRQKAKGEVDRSYQFPHFTQWKLKEITRNRGLRTVLKIMKLINLKNGDIIMKNWDGLINTVINKVGFLYHRRNSIKSQAGKSRNGTLNILFRDT